MTLFDRVFGGNDYNYARTVAAIDADRQGKSPYDFSPTAIEEIRKIKAILDRE